MLRTVCAASMMTISFTSLGALAQPAPPAEVPPAQTAAQPPAVNQPESAPAAARAGSTAAPAGETMPAAGKAHTEAREEPFGKAGVINLASDVALNIQHTGYSAQSGGPTPSSTTTYMFGPAADYFVIDNLSVGALLQIGRESVEAPGASLNKDIIGLEPRIGYHLSLFAGETGLWPRVSFFYEQAKYKSAEVVIDAPSTNVTEKAMGIGFFLPFLIHPVEHFHIGIGPYLKTALSTKVDGQNEPKATTIGLRLEIAGWWKL